MLFLVFSGRRGSPADSTYRDSSASLRSLFSEACVFDVWHHLHPNISAFSWTRQDGLLAFRIDLFACPVSWAHGVRAYDARSLTSLFYATQFLCLLLSPSGPLGGRGREVFDLFSCGGIGARSA